MSAVVLPPLPRRPRAPPRAHVVLEVSDASGSSARASDAEQSGSLARLRALARAARRANRAGEEASPPPPPLMNMASPATEGDFREAAFFSVAAFRACAHDRAVQFPTSGPAHGGDHIATKMVLVVVALAVALSSLPAPCDQPLRPWLYVFVGSVLGYVVVIKLLHRVMRPKWPLAQETLAYALYLAMYPFTTAWLLSGLVLSLRSSAVSCDGGVLRSVSLVVCFISVIYLSLLMMFVVCMTLCSFLHSPRASVRGMANLMRNRLPAATPMSALRALPTVTFSDGAPELAGLSDATCAICLEDYKEGDQVVALPCEPSVPHVFHNSCIKIWLSRSCLCPLCKRDLR